MARLLLPESPSPPVEPDDLPERGLDPEALIKEARKRQRRRRQRLVAIVVSVLAAAGVAYGVGRALSGSGAGVVTVPGGPVVNVAAFVHHGRLAFVSRRDLWVLDGTRGSLRRLATPSGLYPAQPMFSPDGKWLAYLQTPVRPSDVPGSSPFAPGDQLWIARADGSAPRRVRAVDDAVLLGWNPLRDVLAVAAGPLSRKAPYGVQTTLQLVSPDGSSHLLVRAPYVKSAVWSPDGTALAVVSESGLEDQTLAVYPLSRAVPTVWLRYHQQDRLNGMSEIVINAAGWWKGFGIGFWVFGNGMIHNNDATPLDVVSSPGSRPRFLARMLSDGTTRVIAASSAGRLALVADVSNGYGGGRVVWEAKQVQVCGASAACRPVVASPSNVTVDPAWSPDGRTLAFAEAPNLDFPGWPQRFMQRWYANHELRLYDVDRRRLRTIRSARGATVPTWSPDGNSLLYVARDGLWLLPTLSSRPVEIATPLFPRRQWPAYYGQVAWTAQFAWSAT